MGFILLTGGLGFIGSHIAVTLLNNGYKIIILDNLANSKLNVIEKIKKITGKTFTFYKDDLKNNIDYIFKAHDVDTVIHLASLKAVNESINKPLLYYKNNLTSTINLLETMIKYRCFNLVFSSSATVYGNSESPICETVETGRNLTNPYGKTKYMIEEIIKDVCNSHKKFNCISLRYFNPVGAHPSGLIGEDPSGIPNNLMPYILKVAYRNNIDSDIKGYEFLSIFGQNYNTEDGTAIRDYIHVMDLARAHLLSINKISELKGVNFFNIGSGKGYSVLDVVKTFRSINNVSVPYKLKPRRPGDNESVYCDTTKSKNILGFLTELRLTDMCIDSWNFQTRIKI